MADTVIHIRLEKRLAEKLKELARLSHRKQTDLIRLLIDQATDEQVGITRRLRT